METTICENACGGTGTLKLENILGAAQMGDKCSLYARATLPPGSSVGYHVHNGNGECYFILSGAGTYDDNGVKRSVKAGDVTWTPDGSGHSLTNDSGTDDLVFIALIINS